MKLARDQKSSLKTADSNAPVARIKEALEGSSTVLVVSHVNPDGDAIGTQLAMASYLRRLGKTVVLARDSELPARYSFLTGSETIVPAADISDDVAFDTVVVLECPVLDRIGSAVRFIRDGLRVINIDHHADNIGYGDIRWLDSSSSSVGEMLYEYLISCGHSVSSEEAEHLYTAILTDTGRFRFDSTSRRTMEVAGLLLEAGADSSKICEAVYFDHPQSTLRLMGLVLNTTEFLEDGRICFMHLSNAMLQDSGAKPSETEGLIDHTLHTQGVVLGVFFKEAGKGETRVSLRSRPEVDAAALAAHWGGGGHVRAAGCTMPHELEQAKKELLRYLKESRTIA